MVVVLEDREELPRGSFAYFTHLYSFLFLSFETSFVVPLLVIPDVITGPVGPWLPSPAPPAWGGSLPGCSADSVAPSRLSTLVEGSCCHYFDFWWYNKIIGPHGPPALTLYKFWVSTAGHFSRPVKLSFRLHPPRPHTLALFYNFGCCFLFVCSLNHQLFTDCLS